MASLNISSLLSVLLLLLMLSPVSHATTSNFAPPTAARPALEDRYPEHKVSFPNGVVSYPDLTYSTIAGFRPMILDLYFPPARLANPVAKEGARPMVVVVHGGGWTTGHTRHSGAFTDFPAVLAALAAKGYVVASVEYRLSGETNMLGEIQDVKSAVRWLRSNAKKYNIDKSRAVIWGGSAGGHLAALTATSCGVAALAPSVPATPPGAPAVLPNAAPTAEESDCVQGLVTWYGIFDFETNVAQQTAAATAAAAASNKPPPAPNTFGAPFFGCMVTACPEVARVYSPATYANAQTPPALLIHGVGDKTVPVQQSRDFYALLKSKGVPVELIEIPDVDHSFIGASAETTRAASLLAINKTFDFIDATLGKFVGKPAKVK